MLKQKFHAVRIPDAVARRVWADTGHGLNAQVDAYRDLSSSLAVDEPLSDK